MGTHETICRLCLRTNESFTAIDGNIKDVLDKLLPKIDLTVTQEPVVCKNCADILKKCFDFKATCLCTHDNIVSFVNNKNNVKLNLKDVHLSKIENNTGVVEDQDICGFCLGSVKNCSVIFLNIEKGDVMLEKMIKQCLPELDLRIIKRPVICAPCHRSLEDFFHFVVTCLTVEEKIKKYRETLDINSEGQVDISDLLRSTVRGVTASEVGDNSIDIIKVEKQLCEEREIGKEIDTFNHKFWDDSENAKEEVEYKIQSFVDMDDMKHYNGEQFTPNNMLACKDESNDLDVIKTEESFCGESELKKEDFVEMQNQTFLFNEEIEIKTNEADFIRLEDGDILPQPEITSRLYKEQKCIIPNFEVDVYRSNIEQTLPNKNVSTGTTYQCVFCSFQAKYKEKFEVHLRKHKDPSEITMYKCNSCLYQTKFKSYFRSHLLRHKDPSEVTMYKCDFCSFQAKRKYNLKLHSLKHKDPSETTMYKCSSCSYQTKQKYSLKIHFLSHKDPSEVKMYKCSSCSFQTKYKYNLRKHFLTHKDPSEVTMYKCDSCSFQTKHKYTLRKHLPTHEDPSEVTMYKCDSCSFQTKHKGALRKHLLTHKDPSEVTLYKCNSCSFQTKYKQSLKMHFLVHKDPSEVTMHKCDSCSFQAKNKFNLKEHLLGHKDPSEVKMYKCDLCEFQTKHKYSIKLHLQKHKDPSEVTMYKCDYCLYQTIFKNNFESHLRKHKDPTEVTVYKCEYCLFHTKHKHSLKRHLQTHKILQK